MPRGIIRPEATFLGGPEKDSQGGLCVCAAYALSQFSGGEEELGGLMKMRA
jgi:hypothetical protein